MNLFKGVSSFSGSARGQKNFLRAPVSTPSIHGRKRNTRTNTMAMTMMKKALVLAAAVAGAAVNGEGTSVGRVVLALVRKWPNARHGAFGCSGSMEVGPGCITENDLAVFCLGRSAAATYRALE